MPAAEGRPPGTTVGPTDGTTDGASAEPTADPTARTAARSVSCVVLCGGTSRRLGGLDKTRAALGDHAVLDHLLIGLPGDWPVVCVGAERPTARAVTWTRESPPGGGPVAALAAALTVVTSPVCVLLAGDMPFAGAAVGALVAAVRAAPFLDAALAMDPAGRAQPLLAAYDTAALRAAMPDDPRQARVMGLLDRLRWLPVDCDATASLDVDTPEALERARHIVGP